MLGAPIKMVPNNNSLQNNVIVEKQLLHHFPLNPEILLDCRQRSAGVLRPASIFANGIL